MSLEVLHLESDRRLTTVLLTLVLIPAAWFGAVYVSGASHDSPRSLIHLIPHAASGLVAVLGLWFVRQARTRGQLSTAVFATSLAIVPVLLALGLQQPQGWFYQPMQAFLPLIALYGALPNTSARQIGPPWLFTGGLILGRLLWFSDAGGHALSDIVVLTMVNAIGTLMVWRRAALQRLVSEAFQELRTLRGIIPICAHCKKVRTDANEWQQIENYVADHSTAAFSHGICPECIRAFYAESGGVAGG